MYLNIVATRFQLLVMIHLTAKVISERIGETNFSGSPLMTLKIVIVRFLKIKQARVFTGNHSVALTGSSL